MVSGVVGSGTGSKGVGILAGTVSGGVGSGTGSTVVGVFEGAVSGIFR